MNYKYQIIGRYLFPTLYFPKKKTGPNHQLVLCNLKSLADDLGQLYYTYLNVLNKYLVYCYQNPLQFKALPAAADAEKVNDRENIDLRFCGL